MFVAHDAIHPPLLLLVALHALGETEWNAMPWHAQRPTQMRGVSLDVDPIMTRTEGAAYFLAAAGAVRPAIADVRFRWLGWRRLVG